MLNFQLAKDAKAHFARTNGKALPYVSQQGWQKYGMACLKTGALEQRLVRGMLRYLPPAVAQATEAPEIPAEQLPKEVKKKAMGHKQNTPEEKKRMMEIYREKQSINETVKQLVAEGFVSPNTGKPISYSTVDGIINRQKNRDTGMTRPHRKAATKRTVNRPAYAKIAAGHEAILQSVKTVLGLDLDAEEKVALAQLLLERI